MKCRRPKLKAVVRINGDMMYSEVCLIINVCVTLYGAFSMFLWLINVSDSSLNTVAACGLIIAGQDNLSK